MTRIEKIEKSPSRWQTKSGRRESNGDHLFEWFQLQTHGDKLSTQNKLPSLSVSISITQLNRENDFAQIFSISKHRNGEKRRNIGNKGEEFWREKYKNWFFDTLNGG